MTNALPYALLVAMAATFVVLVIGIIGMFRRKKNRFRRANLLMRYRLVLQALALALLVALWYVARQ